jgi:hypothetical protein
MIVQDGYLDIEKAKLINMKSLATWKESEGRL